MIKRLRHVLRLVISLLPVCSLFLLLDAGTAWAQSESEEPITIGMISSLTGAAHEQGHDLVNGLQLYLDQTGDKIAGRKVRLLVENDESSPVTGIAKFKKLTTQDKASVVTGLIFAHIGIAVAAQAEKDRFPLVLSVCAADELTQSRHGEWVIRAGFTSSQPMHPFGEYVYKTLGYRKVITLGHDFPYAWEQVGGFQRTFEQAGGKIIQKIWVPLGFTDHTSYLKKMRTDGDAVLICTTSAGAVVIPDEYKKMGFKMPIIAGSSSYDETVLRHVGDEALGVVSANFYSSGIKNPNNERFVKAYRKKYGNNPSLFAECGYTSGLVIGKAIEAVHGDVEDKASFMAALRKVELKNAPRGPFKLDDFGNPIENCYVLRAEPVNGKLQNTVIGTFNNVSQFWRWKPEAYLKMEPYTRTTPACPNCTP